MVRVNIINPGYLTDQHLIAEYLEIIMLIKYIRNHPHIKDIPKEYCLGKGHMKFFKDKLEYLQKRHKDIKEEMKKRGFQPKENLDLKGINSDLLNGWRPKFKDYMVIKKRLMQKINLKPGFYRYYRDKKSRVFLLNLVKQAK